MYTQQDLANLSDEDKKKQKRSIEMEIIISESDLKKMITQKSALEAEIRKLRYEEEKLRIELDQKNDEFKLVGQKIMDSEEEIKRLRKRLNLL